MQARPSNPKRINAKSTARAVLIAFGLLSSGEVAEDLKALGLHLKSLGYRKGLSDPNAVKHRARMLGIWED